MQLYYMHNSKHGFQVDYVDVRTSDGLIDILLGELPYIAKDGTNYKAPVGGTTDGLSVPRCIQNIIPATGGDWFSGVLHDSAYRNQLMVFKNEEWIKADLTREQADDLMLEAMESQGCNIVMRHTIYRALRMFGWKAYNDNRKK
jgi:hypothetical protein